jgi:hypothetical protein
MMKDIGFTATAWTPVLRGFMAINSGIRPEE